MAERVAFIVVIVDGFSRLEFNRLSPLFDKYIDAVDPPSTCVLLSRRPENGGLEFHATTSSVLLTQTQFVPSAWHVSPTGLPAQLCQHTLVMSPKIIGAPVGTAV